MVQMQHVLLLVKPALLGCDCCAPNPMEKAAEEFQAQTTEATLLSGCSLIGCHHHKHLQTLQTLEAQACL